MQLFPFCFLAVFKTYDEAGKCFQESYKNQPHVQGIKRVFRANSVYRADIRWKTRNMGRPTYRIEIR